MYEKSQKSWIKHLDFLILDLICIEIAYALSFEFRYLWFRGETENFWIMNPLSSTLHRQVAVLLIVFYIILALFRNTYRDILRRGFWQEFKNVFIQNSFNVIALILYLYATKEGEAFSRASFGFTWGVSVVLIYLVHLGWKHFLRKRMDSNQSLPGLLIVTTSKRAEGLIQGIKNHRYNGFRIVGVALLGENHIGETVCGEQVVADEHTMFDYVLENVVDGVLFSDDFSEQTQQLYAYRFLSMGQTVHIDLNRNDADYPNKMIQNMGNMTVLTSSIKTVERYQLVLKRMLDILGGIVGSILTLIIAVILCPVIKKQSPGPLFFTQTRVGKNGRKFKIYKFRSMYMDAEARKAELMKDNEMQGFMFKMENDPRIFPAGHFIRKYSIDELPQFFNILKGDMSLVGTRPPTVEEYEQYELHHKIRLSIKPGLTGLWQVSGRSDIKDFEQVVRLDEQYIRDWNFGMDIRILLKTVQVVFHGDGAM